MDEGSVIVLILHQLTQKRPEKSQRLRKTRDASHRVIIHGAELQPERRGSVCGTVVLNWWVETQKWVADLFSVGRGPLSGEGSVIHTP